MDEDYSDPYKNYQRLLDTINIIKSGTTVHQNFYDIHIDHIHTYLNVLIDTPEVNQAASEHLQVLITQYELFNEFDLSVYLTACELLLGNVGEFEVYKMMNSLTF
jgi:hypothetical protein